MDIQRLPLVVAGKNLPCAKGTKVVGGSGFVWLSGAVGEDIDTGNIPEEAGAQAELAMENIKARLEEYGSSMQNIVHVWLYVKGQFPKGMVNDSRYLDVVKAIEGFWSINHPEFLRGNNPPASTHLGVTSLARPTFHVEILVVAAIE